MPLIRAEPEHVGALEVQMEADSHGKAVDKEHLDFDQKLSDARFCISFAR
jgi:hypothetical protein